MGTPSGQENALDRLLAAAAGLAGAQVDAVLKLEEAADAVGIYVVRNRGAAQLNGVVQNLAECLAETLQLGPGKPAGGAARTDAGVEEAFVGVDVAHPGQQRLVEQRGLDG